MKQLLLPAALLLLSSPAYERIGTRYEEGQAIRVTTHSKTTTQVESVEVEVNGQEMPSPDQEREPQTQESHMEFVDHVMQVDGGRRTAVERSFDTIAETIDDDTGSRDRTGVLDGRTIRLAENDDGDTVATVADDQGDVGATYLENFDLRYDEEHLLPEGDVEVGDTWTVDGDEANRFLGMADGVTWYEQDEDDDSPDFEELLGKNAETTVDVTLAGEEDHEGEACWLLTYDLRFESSVDDLDPSDLGLGGENSPFTDDAGGSMSLDGSGEGRLWVSKDSHHLVGAEGKGDAELVMKATGENQGLTIALTVTLSVALEGGTTWTGE